MKFWKHSSAAASFELAREMTKYYSKSFYISARMLPRDKRWATFALYGFCRYADNLIDNPRERTASELLNELDFLSEELKVAYRTGESEHPVLKSFIVIAREYGIPLEYPLDLLEGVEMDIQNPQFVTTDELFLFSYRVAGVVGLMMTYVLGYKTERAFLYAEKLGIAMQLTNILRDIKEDKDMGRIYLPQEELLSFGVSHEDIRQENMTDNMKRLMKYNVKRAHSLYREANKGIPMLHTDSQFAIYSASKIYSGILRKIEARDYNPFLGRVYVPQGKKLQILTQEIFKTKTLTFQERILLPMYKMISMP
ncbi:phytoene/squalene synthase family protein [candidate division KSB1 bacterium]|nr:phytoene/squalene synthase family protein [candidate division KSB1 bacterium]